MGSAGGGGGCGVGDRGNGTGDDLGKSCGGIIPRLYEKHSTPKAGAGPGSDRIPPPSRRDGVTRSELPYRDHIRSRRSIRWLRIEIRNPDKEHCARSRHETAPAGGVVRAQHETPLSCRGALELEVRLTESQVSDYYLPFHKYKMLTARLRLLWLAALAAAAVAPLRSGLSAAPGLAFARETGSPGGLAAASGGVSCRRENERAGVGGE
ncbi:Protein of unknown function [Gryllus bimaculatus]|nr:Protein of unknown function [Gryllus bimaculatus]